MLMSTNKLILAAAVVASCWVVNVSASGTANAADGRHKARIQYQQPHDIFYNNFVGPGPGGVPAQMYMSPRPVPAHVGHMYNTYPAFYPQEMMHKHRRSWYTYHRGAGWNRTKVYYSARPGLDLLGHMRRF